MTKITITEVDEDKVEFTSALGNGAAKWVGVPPQQGNAYDVEIDVNDNFQWGKNITITTEEASEINTAGDDVLFYGKVLAYENDGILTVKVGEGIIFLEVSNTPGEGKYVSFLTSISNVSLHPINL